MVVFGAGGDLTHRLLVPALYNLSRAGLIPPSFALVGVDIAERTPEAWRDSLRHQLDGFVGNTDSEAGLPSVDADAWARLTGRLSYVQGDFADPGLFVRLGEQLAALDASIGAGGNFLFYLAVADRFFGPIVDQLGHAGLTDEQPDAEGAPSRWRRVVIEKPFGHSLDSARALNARILKVLDEKQIFRIDHFLGKETVQNIMAFRFANGIFEPIWNRDRIDHVQITVAETVGVERRGTFYEHTGALRDMVPNHLFQLLAMTTMEPPISFEADEIRAKKADVLAAVRAVPPGDAVRGQYGPGSVAGAEVRAYRAEPDVSPESNIETYCALKLTIDNWRWSGVPFYLRTGKHMARRTSEIAIRFKQAPTAPFEDTEVATLPPNWLVLQIQPEEGISLQFEVKRPGPLVELAPVRMAFRYSDWFHQEPSVGYETLIYDCMIGDQTLFQRADMVEAGWRIVQKVLDYWADAIETEFPNYASGSDGPTAAEALIRRDRDCNWRPVAIDPPPPAAFAR